MSRTIFVERTCQYREEPCPYTREYLERLPIDELCQIAKDHGSVGYLDHYNNDVTIRYILSCYSPMAKHFVKEVKDWEEAVWNDMKNDPTYILLSMMIEDRKNKEDGE